MGVGIEYFRKHPSVNPVFIKPGSCTNEAIIGQKTRMVVVSSTAGDRGTIFVAGITRNVTFHLFENEADEVGHPVKAEFIDDTEKTGVFVDFEREQEVLVTVKKSRVEEQIGLFVCKSEEAFAERLIE